MQASGPGPPAAGQAGMCSQGWLSPKLAPAYFTIMFLPMTSLCHELLWAHLLSSNLRPIHAGRHPTVSRPTTLSITETERHRLEGTAPFQKRSNVCLHTHVHTHVHISDSIKYSNPLALEQIIPSKCYKIWGPTYFTKLALPRSTEKKDINP